MIFYGTDVKQGSCTGVVLYTGDDTFIGKIAALTESTETEQTPINKELHHFIKFVSVVAIILGVTFFVIGLALGTDLITNLVFMIGVIVANVPEGLLATVTVCLTLTSKSMAGKNVLVKNMEGVETLGSTTCICSDKTGTLTQNKMTVAEVILDRQIMRTEFVESERSRNGEAGFAAIDSSLPSFQFFHKALCLNTTATFKESSIYGNERTRARPFFTKTSADAIPMVQWDTQGDASESSIIKFAQFMHPTAYSKTLPIEDAEIMKLHDRDLVRYSRAAFPKAVNGEIPFNSANKYHLKITENQGNTEVPYTVWMKGAPERIITRCSHYIHNGEVHELTPEAMEEIDSLQQTLMRKGRRVLGFAYCDIANDMLPSEKTETAIVKKVDKKGRPVMENGKPVMEETHVSYRFDPDTKNFPMGEPVDPRLLELDPDHKYAEHRLTFIGMAALIDPPRPSVPDAVLSCQRAGIRVVMVTGDHPETAAAIAKMVNIITDDHFKVLGPLRPVNIVDPATNVRREVLADPCEYNDDGLDVSASRAIVVPGWEFHADTTDAKWEFIFAHDEIVFARTSPQQKLQIVQRFQQMKQEIVAVTGDGVNDAPALKKADIGVAMGIAGTEVSKTAADMILTDDNFASIVNGVEEGRLIFDNLKKSISYTLSSNIGEVVPFLVFITVRTPLPLSTVLILCIDLGTDMVPAISMAWENAENDIMRRPPRDSAVDRLVTRKLILFSYLQIGLMQALAGFYAYFVVMNDYGFKPSMLPGLAADDNWGKQVLYCELDGGVFRNLAGQAADAALSQQEAVAQGYLFWDRADNGDVVTCTFPSKNFRGDGNPVGTFEPMVAATYGEYTDGRAVASLQSIRALREAGYVEFIPWRGVTSPFWDDRWLAWNLKDDGVPGAGSVPDDSVFFSLQNPGVWDIDPSSATSDDARGSSKANELVRKLLPNGDKMFSRATFLQPTAGDTTSDAAVFGYAQRNADGDILVNVASRMIQKEALHHAQCSYFIAVVVGQWADLLICKTRWLSLYHQGMRNSAMNFGLVFETILAALLCYVPGLNAALGTRNLRALHWLPAVPFAIVIFFYDEARKYIMRSTSTAKQQGQQIVMQYGWLARHTYY